MHFFSPLLFRKRKEKKVGLWDQCCLCMCSF